MKLRKWTVLLVLVFLLFNLFLVRAEAVQGDIKIWTETGFDGKLKSGRGFPVTVTIENSGKDFSGDLLLNFYPTYNSAGSKAIKVDLPKGSKKTYSVSLPGISDESQYNNRNIQTIFLYEGSWKDGKETKFTGVKSLMPKYSDPMRKTLGLLSEDPDRLKELKVLPDKIQTDVVVLEGAMVPEDKTGLENLDYLLIDEFALSSLKPSQQEAITDWVQNGGIVLAGGSPNASQSYGDLYKNLPMETDETSPSNLTLLKSSTNPGQELAAVPAFYGKTAPEAELVLKSGEIPLVVKKTYGAGEIWQTSFSLGDAPLSSWKGYSDWFSSILVQTQSSKVGSSQGGPNPYEQLYYDFAEANEYFPSVHFSLGQISVMLVIYLLAAAPLLYFILKRVDKREHAWWIIPVFALLCSSAIFALGAKDRIAKPQVSQMGVYKAEGGMLQGLEAISLLSNTSGDYQIKFPLGEFSGIPGSSSVPSSAPQRFAIVEDSRKETIATFPNVEYWALRTMFGKSLKKNAGEFEIELKHGNNKLTGKITNNFPYDFEKLYLWSGSQRIELGSLKQGETLEIKKTVKQSLLTGPLSPGYAQPTMGSKQDIDKMKKTKLEYAAIEFLYNQSKIKNLPIIYGFSNEPVLKADLSGKDEASNSNSLIYQAVDIESDITGSFTIKSDVLSSDLKVVQGMIHENEKMQGIANEMMLENGEYDYLISLPNQLVAGKTDYQVLTVDWYSANATYSLLDNQSGELIPLTNSHTALNENVERYLSKDGKISIKLTKTGQGDPLVRMPTIILKGEVKP